MSTAITRRTAEVPIFQGDDLAAIEQAEIDFAHAEADRKSGPAGRLNPDTSNAQEAADKFDALVKEAMTRAVKVKVQAIGRKYRHLLVEHPPRADNATDEQYGFNETTFFDALLEYFDGETGDRTIIEPPFTSRQELVDWLNGLTDGQFTELAATAVRVNQGGQPDPKASLGSRAAQMYAATLPSHDSTD